MKRNQLKMLALVTIILTGSCGPPVDLDAEGQRLMQLSRDWSDLVATGDMDAIMESWAEDAVMMPPGFPMVEGKSAIRDYVNAAGQIPGFQISWEPISAHVASSGDMAYMIERNVTTMNDSLGNPVTVYGKVVTVWRKDEAGRWRNVIDMWNEAPPPR